MAFKVIFLVTLGCLAASATVLEPDGDAGPLSINCIRALYEVINLDSDSCTGSRCNPFKISIDQWRVAFNVRAGEGANAYDECMLSHWCSVRTVQEYMSKTLPLCVRRTPNTDAYRTVCESALILQLYDPAQCLLSSNDGTIQTYRELLLASLDCRTIDFLKKEACETEDNDSNATETNGLNDFKLQDQLFAETQLTDDSIQENKLNFSIVQLLNENEMDLHASSETPERN